MKVTIGNCSGGKGYITIEARWMNIMAADPKTIYKNDLPEDEGYCDVKMVIGEEHKEEYLENLSQLDSIKDLCILDDDDGILLVEFFTSDDIDIT